MFKIFFLRLRAGKFLVNGKYLMMFRSIVFVGLITTFFVISVASVSGQTGTIDGAVVDPQGANLNGVTVTAASPALNEPVVAITDSSGVFQLDALPSGTYSVLVSLDGSDSQRHDGITL